MMVGVCLITYNQEQYISQAIDSVLAQVGCGEEIRIYVGDDCSTDQTGDICKEYGNKIVYIRQVKNLGLVGNTLDILSRIIDDGCDYVAMLDGDDYWCDEHKLQKEISFLAQHQDCGLIHTCVDIIYNEKIIQDKRNKASLENVFGKIENYRIGNCSVVFRTSLLSHIKFQEFSMQGFMSCDYVMYAIFSKYTKFGFIPEHTAIWRRGHNSVSNTNDIEKQIYYINNDLAQWKYLASNFPERWQYDKSSAERYYHKRAFTIAFNMGDYFKAKNECGYISNKSIKDTLRKWCLISPPTYKSVLWIRNHIK